MYEREGGRERERERERALSATIHKRPTTEFSTPPLINVFS
jgi:hypothetical protein